MPMTSPDMLIAQIFGHRGRYQTVVELMEIFGPPEKFTAELPDRNPPASCLQWPVSRITQVSRE
jgi:hypothetical protein